MISKHIPQNENGYILLYVVVAITIFAALAVSIVSSTVNQVELSVQELAAVKAQAAADMAAECISYWADKPELPFYTNTPSMSVACGNTSFNTAGGAVGPCVASTNTYKIGPLSNGSCAMVTINTQPRNIRLTHPSVNRRYYSCALRVRADGFDSCTATTTSRTRWEEFGEYEVGGSSETSNAQPPAVPVVGPPDATELAYIYDIFASVDNTAVLQVGVRPGSSNSSSTSNTITIKVRTDDIGFPFGDVVGFALYYPLALDGLIYEFNPAFVNISGTVGNPSRFATTSLKVAIPSNTTAGVYPLTVLAFYGEYSTSSVVIPLDAVVGVRGQQ